MKIVPESPFAILGVRPDTPDAEVKAAWLAKVQACHPDLLGTGATPEALFAAEERTKRLNVAYAEIKARRAAGQGPAPRQPDRPGRANAGVDEPRTAAEALHRAERAVEDARAAVEDYERTLGLARGAVRQVRSDLAAREARSLEVVGLAQQADQLAGALAVAARDAAARAMAGEALATVVAARKLPVGYVAERRTQRVRAEALAGAGLTRLDAGRSAARSLLEDVAQQVDRLLRRVRPVATELTNAAEKAVEEVKRYRTLHPTLPARGEPARAAVDKAVVAAARARGMVDAEAPALEASMAAQLRRRAAATDTAAAGLAQRCPTDQPVPTGTPGALPKPEALAADHARLQAAATAAQTALARANAARTLTEAARMRGADAVVALALQFIDAEIATLRVD